jgi:hypothetical protein
MHDDFFDQKIIEIIPTTMPSDGKAEIRKLHHK